MTGNIRQGIGLLLLGLLVWLLAPSDSIATEVVSGAGVLLALIGAVLLILELLKSPQRD